jgi:uncharacterized damage-inducible protein DinB
LDFLAKARRQMLAGQMNDARERLLDSFAGLTNEQMGEPGVDGERSVKDILANVAAWDRAYAATFKAMLEGERHPMLDMDEEGVESFNAEQQARDKDKTADEVVTELNAAWDDLIVLLREVDNTQLFAPAPGDEHADMSIAACLALVVSEDEEHADMIEQWREGLE